MTVDVKGILMRGGRGQIDLLEFCVRSINTDALFFYCVDEYRLRPQAAAALAIFDMFCAAEAPARVTAVTLLPPKDVRLARAVEPFRTPTVAVLASDDSAEEPLPPPAFPPKYLFDTVAEAIAAGGTLWQGLASTYDPEKDPCENLSGGEMTAPQRAFVDWIWTPIVRPTLVSAGFRKLASIA